jgi:UDP-sugar diphosphatase
MSGITIDDVSPLDPKDAKYIKAYRLDYTQSGKKKVWECTKVHDSVAVVLYNKSRDVLIFVKQIRPAVLFAASVKDVASQELGKTRVTGYTLENVAGICDKDGSSTQQVTKEEILEEAGYEVPLESIKFISSFRSGVGVSGSLQYLYFCEVDDSQKRKGHGGGVGDEEIEVVELTPQDAFKLLYVKDEDLRESRPASFLFALSWFRYQYYPNRELAN